MPESRPTVTTEGLNKTAAELRESVASRGIQITHEQALARVQQAQRREDRRS